MSVHTSRTASPSAGAKQPRPRQDAPPVEDWSTADDEFCAFFRCTKDVASMQQLDRLSLLACRRQGVEPHELLPDHAFPAAISSTSPVLKLPPAKQPRSSSTQASSRAASAASVSPREDLRSDHSTAAATPSRPRSNNNNGGRRRSYVRDPAAAVEEAVLAAATKRRSAKFSIVEAARKRLHAVVMSAAEVDHLSHEQHQLLMDLRAQQQQQQQHGGRNAEPSTTTLRCSDPDENAEVDAFLTRVYSAQPERARLQQAIDEAKQRGDHEVQKLRERNLRFVAHDVQVERQRQEMLDRIEQRDAAYREQQAARAEALERQARAEARAHRRKVHALQMRNAIVQEHREKTQLERAERRRDVRLTVEQQKAKEAEERRKRSAQLDAEARLRCDAVRKQIEEKCDRIEHGLIDKHMLHEERKTVVQLQLAVSRESRRLDAARKFQAAQVHLSKTNAEALAKREEMERRDAEEQKRKAEQEEANRRHLRHESLLRGDTADQTAERRAEFAEQKARRDLELLQKEVEMERSVEAAKQEREQRIRALSALGNLKRLHHEDNLQRLERQHANKQRLKAALLQEAAERDEERRRLQNQMSRKLQATRQELNDARDRVQNQVSTLRTSKALLTKSPEDILNMTLTSSHNSPHTRESGPRPGTVPASTQRPHRSYSSSAAAEEPATRPATTAEGTKPRASHAAQRRESGSQPTKATDAVEQAARDSEHRQQKDRR